MFHVLKSKTKTGVEQRLGQGRREQNILGNTNVVRIGLLGPIKGESSRN